MKILTAILLMFLSSCASVPDRKAYLSAQNLMMPPINVKHSTRIGDEVTKSVWVTKYEALKIKSHINAFLVDIPPITYAKISSDEKYDYYFDNAIEPYKALRIEKDILNEVCLITHLGGVTCEKGQFERVTKTRYAENKIQKLLIYSGRIDNNLKFIYREFIEGQVSSGFSHEVNYDMSSGGIIAYKNLKLQVFNADNSTLDYLIMRHFE